MLGKTNAINKSVSGGSGDVVQAVNLTGNLINTGDKVWVNYDTQMAGSCYNIEGYASNNVNSSPGVLSPNGTLVWRRGSLFAVGSDGVSRIGDFQATCDRIYYMGEHSLFISNNRCDDVAQYTNSHTPIIGSNDLFYQSTSQIHQLNLADGSIIKTWNSDNISGFSDEIVKIGNYIYRLNTADFRRLELQDDLSIKISYYNYENGYSYSLYPFGVTSDGQYIISATSRSFSNNTKDNYLRIIKVVDDNHLKVLTQAEMPADLQKYYATSGLFVFNPYTDILTAAVYNGNEYDIMKYNSGLWQKLTVDLGISEENMPIRGAITLSDNLSRACVAYGSTPNWYAYIVNLVDYSGYVINKYSDYNINSNTITGFANADIANFATGEISTALKAHVSYPEPEPEPSTEQYEINQDTQGGIVFVGDLQTVAGPYGNTVAQITDTTRLTLGNDGANIFAGMFADTQTADCFRIKFKMPRKGISSGGTWFALSDSLSQNVENPTDGCVRFGFTASWDEQNSEIDSQVVSFVMERYSSEQGWETLTEVIMPDFKLNTWYDVMYYYGKYADWEIEENGNSGYRLFINVYNEGGELIGREIYDNYPNGSIVSTENVQIGYPIYATSYFYIDVDLSQTGFQLLDSWVWRPVKEINK